MPSSNDSLGQPEDHAAVSTSSIQNPAEGSSYGQILRSSSIIGGATGLHHLSEGTLALWRHLPIELSTAPAQVFDFCQN